MSRILTKGELIRLLEQAPTFDVQWDANSVYSYAVAAIKDPVEGCSRGPRVFMLETRRGVDGELRYQQISTVERDQEFAYRDGDAMPWTFDKGAKEKTVDLNKPVCFAKAILDANGGRKGWRYVDAEGRQCKALDPVIV